MDTDRELAPAIPGAFRGVAAHLVTGVSIVATLTDEEPFATTAGSVVAASWEPPLLAVLFRIGSRMDAALARAERFTVNVLGEADHGLARRFARPDRGSGWAAFAGVPLVRRDPSPPVFATALAWAECTVAQVVTIGDHRCYVGEVLDLDRDNGAAPLTYYRGRFRGLGPALAPATWYSGEVVELATTW